MYENTLIGAHTAGTLAGTPLTTGANLGVSATTNTWAASSSIDIDGATSGTTLKAGDVLTFGTLAAGQSVTVTAARAVSADLTNIAVVTGTDPVGTVLTNSDPAVVDRIDPAIAIANTVNGAELATGTNGTPVTYRFVVSNLGDVPLANVSVTNAALGFFQSVGGLAVCQSGTKVRQERKFFQAICFRFNQGMQAPQAESNEIPLDIINASDVLVNNNTGAIATAYFTQSETSILAFGSNVLIGFNDSGSNNGCRQIHRFLLFIKWRSKLY